MKITAWPGNPRGRFSIFPNAAFAPHSIGFAGLETEFLARNTQEAEQSIHNLTEKHHASIKECGSFVFAGVRGIRCW